MNYTLKSYVTEYPDAVQIPGRHGLCYWLQERIEWINADDVRMYVPKGFVSDGYSVPPCLWGLIRGLKSMVPAFHHDWQFLTGETKSLLITNLNITRGVVLTGSGKYNAAKIMAGLTIGSWKPWYANTRLRNKYGYEFITNRQIATSLDEAKRIAMEVL